MASLLSGGGNPFFGLEMLNQTLDQNQAWKEQQRRNALEEAYTAAQRDRQAQAETQQTALANSANDRRSQTDNALRYGLEQMPYLSGDIAPRDYNSGLDEIRADMVRNAPQSDPLSIQKFGEYRDLYGEKGSQNAYYTPIQTGDGFVSFNNRTGDGSPLTIGGRPVIGSNSDPLLQGRIAEAKAGGKIEGETATQARIELPKYVQEASDTIDRIDDLLKHPGKSLAVGKSSVLGIQKIPGTEAKSFMVALEQIKGKQFLQAFESLKGGGQITEIEGQKATNAMSRMDNANSDKEFDAAAREFQTIIRRGVERAKVKAKSGTMQPTQEPAPPAPKFKIISVQ